MRWPGWQLYTPRLGSSRSEHHWLQLGSGCLYAYLIAHTVIVQAIETDALTPDLLVLRSLLKLRFIYCLSAIEHSNRNLYIPNTMLVVQQVNLEEGFQCGPKVRRGAECNRRGNRTDTLYIQYRG